MFVNYLLINHFYFKLYPTVRGLPQQLNINDASEIKYESTTRQTDKTDALPDNACGREGAWLAALSSCACF